MILGVVTVAFFVMTGAAQQRPQQPPKRPDETKMVAQRTSDMVKTYGLNKLQAAKLLTLNKKYPHVAMGPGGPGGRPPGNPPKDGQRPSMPKDGKQASKNDGMPPKGKGGTPPPTAGNRPPEPLKDGHGPGGKCGLEAELKAYRAQLAKIMTATQYKKYMADEKKNRSQPPRKK